MRIAINTRFLLKGRLEGIGTFTHEVCSRLALKHPEHEFVYLFDRKFDPSFCVSDNIKPVVVHPQARHPFLYYLWFEWSVPYALQRHKADLFFSPDGYLSLRSNCPMIHVIHDLAFEHYPKDIDRLHAWHYRHYFPLYAQKANRILTVSEYTKKDVLTEYGVSEDKIDVVYNGSRDCFNPIAESEKPGVRNQYSDGKPYFLYVGALHQRKNITRLLLAFEEFARAGGEEDLVIVGRKAWGTEEMEQVYSSMQHRDRVHFTGRLPDEELNKVLASATALTYVSYFEGFGIPVLEAMQTDTPVITSDCSSMPEVAGEAGILVDPFSTNSIVNAMHSMSKDETLRNELVEKGRAQRQKFSWDITADKAWRSIEQVLQGIE